MLRTQISIQSSILVVTSHWDLPFFFLIQAKTRVKLNFLDKLAKFWELQVRFLNFLLVCWGVFKEITFPIRFFFLEKLRDIAPLPLVVVLWDRLIFQYVHMLLSTGKFSPNSKCRTQTVGSVHIIKGLWSSPRHWFKNSFYIEHKQLCKAVACQFKWSSFELIAE